jgi:hypothetical protein
MEYIIKIFKGTSINDFEDLKDMMSNTQLLLDLNIIDFSSNFHKKIQFINFLTFSIF